MTLIEQTSRSEQSELAILTPIAFLSLSPTNGGFQEVYHFATDILSLKKMFRFATLQKLQDDFLLTNVYPAADTLEPVTGDEVTALLAQEDRAGIAAYGEQENKDLANRFRT